MKQAVATTLTLALIVGALYLGRNATEKSSFTAASPAECLEQMYLAAERGDVDAYLACFTGVQRQRLDVELRTESREAFAAAIAEPFGSLKGRAINDLSTEPADGERAQLEAERIYPQYNEAPDIRLPPRRRGLANRIAWRRAEAAAAGSLRHAGLCRLRRDHQRGGSRAVTSPLVCGLDQQTRESADRLTGAARRAPIAPESAVRPRLCPCPECRGIG